MTTKSFQPQAAQKLLNVSPDVLRRYVDDSGIEVERQQTGPNKRLYSIENIYDLARWRSRHRPLKDFTIFTKFTEKGMKQPVIATIYAPKGGVGKTTLAYNFASLFPFYGMKVLVIDLDFQSNLSLAFGYDSDLTEEAAQEVGIPMEKVIKYHLGDLHPQWPKGARSLNEVIKKPYGENGPHLIPSDLSLDNFDLMTNILGNHLGQSPEIFLTQFINQAINGDIPGVDFSQYDVILFDAAPAKNSLTRGALLASDYVISPVSMEKFSTKSLSYLADTLHKMQENLNRSPELVIVGNFYDPTRVRVMSQKMTITKEYTDSWLDATIRRSEEFPKNMEQEEFPISISRPGSEVASEIRLVASSLLQHMGLIKVEIDEQA